MSLFQDLVIFSQRIKFKDVNVLEVERVLVLYLATCFEQSTTICVRNQAIRPRKTGTSWPKINHILRDIMNKGLYEWRDVPIQGHFKQQGTSWPGM
jgi:hypothetical protein